jgi:hypothetical protein
MHAECVVRRYQVDLSPFRAFAVRMARQRDAGGMTSGPVVPSLESPLGVRLSTTAIRRCFGASATTLDLRDQLVAT